MTVAALDTSHFIALNQPVSTRPSGVGLLFRQNAFLPRYRQSVSTPTQEIAEVVRDYEDDNDETVTLQSRIAKAKNQFLSVYLDEEYQLAGWDGYDADPLNKASAVNTHEVVVSLLCKFDIDQPDYAVDPDGDFSAHWDTSKGQLTFSVSENKVCSFSAITNQNEEYLGSFELLRGVSDVFLKTVQQIF